MLQDTQGTGNHNVLQDRTIWNIDGLTLIDNDNHSSLQSDVSAQVDITSNSQVVQLQNLRHVRNSLLEVIDLLEVRAQLDQWVGKSISGRVQFQGTVLKEEQVRLHQKQVGTSLDRQESRSWNHNTVSTLKVSNGSTNSGLQLQDVDVGVSLGDGLLVRNDLGLDAVGLHQSLDSTQVDPQVVGVEVLELLDTLEVLNVLLWHLSDFQQTHLAVVVDQGTTLDVGSGLVGQFHEVLGTGLDHVVQDVGVDSSTQVVTVGNKQDLSTLSQQGVQLTGGKQTLKQVTVSWRVPALQIVVVRVWDRQERVLEDSRELGLVESSHSDPVALVLLDDLGGVGVGVERVHQQERHVGVVSAVQVLNLSHGQVQERVAVSHLNHRLGTHATHGGTQTSVQLQHGQFGQVGGLLLGSLRQLGVLHNLAGAGRLDLVPVQRVAAGLVGDVSSEQGKERVHLGLELALSLGVLDGVDQVVQGIAHLRSSHGGGGVVEGLALLVWLKMAFELAH